MTALKLARFFLILCLLILGLALNNISISATAPLVITQGAANDQVFQRNEQNRATIKVTGACDFRDNRAIEARVLRRLQVVDGYDWTAVGSARNGAWEASVKDLPVGGPYDIEFRAVDTGGKSAAATSVRGILVGDLWILAGQSNMEGVGDLIDVEPPNELVHSFDMADRWMVAEEPLHWLLDSVDPIHWRRNAQRQPERLVGEAAINYRKSRRKGAGLGLPFAVEMVRRTGVPVGLIPCAHGGTSMAQWDPALKDQGGESLYGSMFRRFRTAGGQVKGLLWYQGESDANERTAPLFKDKFKAFVDAARRDFGQPDLPFYYVQIGRHIAAYNPYWNQVQESQRQVEAELQRSGMAATVDLELDDGIHIGTQDLKRLGKRLANLATHDLFPELKTNLKSGPRPSAVKLDGNRLLVEFTGVNGKLISSGRVAGFSIRNAEGAEVPLIFRALIDPHSPNTVVLKLGGKLPAGAVLWYGWGKDPYCNLRDEADMAAPVFGPWQIPQP